jgi:hypothetical protein
MRRVLFLYHVPVHRHSLSFFFRNIFLSLNCSMNSLLFFLSDINHCIILSIQLFIYLYIKNEIQYLCDVC